MNNPDKASYNNTHAIELASESTGVPPISLTPICIAGFDSNCLAKPLLVPDSNDLWAYYIYNNIYFEYPSNWRIQQTINKEELIILPAREPSEETNLNLIALMFPSNLVIENWGQVLRSSQPLWERTNTKWQQVIYMNDDFQGFEWFWKPFNEPGTLLEFFLYNEDTRIAVGLLAKIEDDNVAKLIENPDAVKEVLPNIQHIAESIQIWKPYYQEPAGSDTIP